MGKGTEKDLFHGQGNSTIALPKHVHSGKRTTTNPYMDNPGVLAKGQKKVVRKGWNK